MKTETQTDTYTPIFIAALVPRAKSGNNPRAYPDDWKDEVWCILQHNIIQPHKMNEVLMHALTYMNLDHMMLSETVNQ